MRMTEEELRRVIDNNPALKIRDSGAKKSPAQTAIPPEPEFDSEAERKFYNRRVIPGLVSGFILSCELHREFEVVEAVTHCGKTYRPRVYTPDFVLSYADGTVEVIEVKGKQVKKMQRDYPLRRQLFIIKYCIPNKWKFIEVPAEEL